MTHLHAEARRILVTNGSNQALAEHGVCRRIPVIKVGIARYRQLCPVREWCLSEKSSGVGG